MPISQAQYNNVLAQCDKVWDGIFDFNSGNIVFVPDGTIYADINIGNGQTSPYQITQTCCSILKDRLLAQNPPQYPSNVVPDNIFFDLDEQKCRWSYAPDVSCSTNDTPIKIVLNPVGNDGAFFTLTEDDTCRLEIKFNYLFKIKCKTLEEIIKLSEAVGTTNPLKTDDNLTVLRQEKFKKESELLEVNNQLENLSKQAGSTPYSIVCSEFPVDQETAKQSPSTDITVMQKLPFANTGFGSMTNTDLSASTTKVAPVYETTFVNFCLTDIGLDNWRNILGENNYIEFINGNPNSYTCLDVIEIDKLNKEVAINNQEKLIYACTTPFGQKTSLLNKISELATVQKSLKNEIAVIDSTITLLGDVENPCSTLLGQFETINTSVTLDMIDGDNVLTPNIFSQNFFSVNGNLYDYLVSTQNNSGFFVCGEPNNNETWASGCTGLVYPEFTFGETVEDSEELNVSICNGVKDILYQELYNISGQQTQDDFNTSLSPNVFNSNWLTYTTTIDITSGFTNNQIKLNILVNSSCENFCLLIDQISMTKVCDDIDRQNIFISQSPGFELTRVIDNKKSWIQANSYTERDFYIAKFDDTNKIRQTEYNLDEERLVLNSKEIDLTMNMASAVENDVWCYLVDNPNLLTGTTNPSPCTPSCGDNMIDISGLTSTNINEAKSLETFEEILTSQLIDVKDRKVLSGYPTLRALYDRYMGASIYGVPTSNEFTYEKMDKFTGLIKSYWDDLIEQVVPATTLWGSVKVYTNTMFDQQKFKYRSYSSLFGKNSFVGNNVPSPINSISGQCETVEVVTVLIPVSKDNLQYRVRPIKYGNLCIVQMNTGSEFIGRVEIISG
jgi:hypothetical protein